MTIERRLLGTTASGGESYWWSRVASSGNDWSPAVAVGYESDIYTAGESHFGGLGFFITKHDKEGALIWQKKMNGGTTTDFAKGLALDSSDNIFIVGDGSVVNTGGKYVAKFNSAGTMQWQKSFTDGKNTSITVDSSGNLFILGRSYPEYEVAKLNSSGTVQWQKTFSGLSSAGGSQPRFITLDSSGNIYGCGSFFNPNYGWRAYIFKLNSSGTLQWDKQINTSSTENTTVGYKVVFDSSNNVYFVGCLSTNPASAFLVKYNSSGTQQWIKRYYTGVSGSGIFLHSVAIDDDSLYLTGTYQAAGSDVKMLLMSVDYSGDINWSRSFGDSTENLGQDITTDGDAVIVTGYVEEGNGSYAKNRIVLRVPKDGSLTGTYGGYTYASISLNSDTATSTFSFGATESTYSNSTQTANLTVASSSFTTTLQAIEE
tara:strand:- start:359 stop:1645 length:1287 start_codon:yes stop_codon:yes gene_type:complete